MYVVNVLLILNVLVTQSYPAGRPVSEYAGYCVCCVAATGQTVVYRDMTSVVTLPSFAGQLVTVGAHEVIV